MTERTVRSDPHLSDFESLMLTLERDPHLVSGFANVTLLDRPADLAHMRARLLHGAASIPQLRQRVVRARPVSHRPGGSIIMTSRSSVTSDGTSSRGPAASPR